MEKVLWILREMGAEDLNSLKNRIPGAHSTDSIASAAMSWIFAAVGILAVVMIIVSGVQMSASAGDAGAVAKAKRTMTYSIVGLLVVILGYAIVSFVIGRVQ